MENDLSSVFKPNSRRIPGFDYRKRLHYFITFVTYKRQKLFGHKINGLVTLSPMGEAVRKILETENDFYKDVLHLDVFMVMPDHIHLIVTIENDDSEISIPEYVSRLKTLIMNSIKPGILAGEFPKYEKLLWQKSFIDRIIRNEKDYYQIYRYIIKNPVRDLVTSLDNDEIELTDEIRTILSGIYKEIE